MEIIGVIVAGIIIGVLGKFVAPGDKDNIPIWLTIICGIGGVIIGWYIYTALGGNGSPGIDWIRWLIAIAVAAVLVIIASTLTGRNRKRVLCRSSGSESTGPGRSPEPIRFIRYSSRQTPLRLRRSGVCVRSGSRRRSTTGRAF